MLIGASLRIDPLGRSAAINRVAEHPVKIGPENLDIGWKRAPPGHEILQLDHWHRPVLITRSATSSAISRSIAAS